MAADEEWIGVDLDGTLAFYDHWRAWNIIGEPLQPMVRKVRELLAAGKTVKIMTARVAVADRDDLRCLVTGERITNAQVTEAIQAWCERHIGFPLEVTCVKDLHMKVLYDDRAVQMVPNTGRTLAEEHAAEMSALRGKAYGD